MSALPTLAALAIASLGLAGAMSGLKPGESVTPFNPDHISGPLAGTTKCFVCANGRRPSVQVWVNGESAQYVAKLAEHLEGQVQSHKEQQLRALIVVLTKDKAGTAKEYKNLIGDKASDVCLALLSPSDAAVGHYKINLDGSVKNTVMVYRDMKIEHAMTNVSLDPKGEKQLDGALAAVLK